MSILRGGFNCFVFSSREMGRGVEMTNQIMYVHIYIKSYLYYIYIHPHIHTHTYTHTYHVYPDDSGCISLTYNSYCYLVPWFVGDIPQYVSGSILPCDNRSEVDSPWRIWSSWRWRGCFIHVHLLESPFFEDRCFLCAPIWWKNLFYNMFQHHFALESRGWSGWFHPNLCRLWPAVEHNARPGCQLPPVSSGLTNFSGQSIAVQLEKPNN